MESLEGRLALATFSVLNTDDAGPGSLRQAIVSANAAPTVDTIRFNITGNTFQTIAVLSPLPEITDAVTINGALQPGYAGSPIIELRGAPESGDGLVIKASGTVVKGLWINRFAGSGIRLAADDCTIIGNILGGYGTGSNANNGIDGITVTAGSSGNRIGGTGANSQNIITGNARAGILLTGAGTSNNIVLGNQIGSAGTPVATNSLGVWIASGASGNTLGSTLTSGRNVVAGNTYNGVSITGVGTNSNKLYNNYIGLNAAGDDVTNLGHGVYIAAGASSNQIGGLTGAHRNVISGNAESGIHIDGAATTANVVLGNFIGTKPNGTEAEGNRIGVFIGNQSHDNIIGGIADGSSNTISGNTESGIQIDGVGATGNLIQKNRVGTNPGGTAWIPNKDGIAIRNGASSNTIGGTTNSARNLISGNTGAGVLLTEAATLNNVISRNYIGVSLSGNEALGNQQGILIASAVGTVINTNVIAGNYDHVRIVAGGAKSVIKGNTIGLNAAGTDFPGGGFGSCIYISGDDNVIGGTTPAERNIIAGGAYGIYSEGARTVVTGNYIGTEKTGMIGRGNIYGVYLSGHSATIGGTTAGARNVISSNVLGVLLLRADANVIQGNYIGVAADGSTAMGNSLHGIFVTVASQNNRIGGEVSGAGNVIANNGGDGILIGTDSRLAPVILGTAGNGNRVSGNVIYANVGQSIDLGDNDGATANDGQDSDTGPNNLQNAATITTTIAEENSTLLFGSLTSAANRSYRIEFFSSTVAGQAKRYLGYVDVFTNANGVVNFQCSLPELLSDPFITATTTDLLTGDTSELV